jgi:hypothetical protein
VSGHENLRLFINERGRHADRPDATTTILFSQEPTIPSQHAADKCLFQLVDLFLFPDFGSDESREETDKKSFYPIFIPKENQIPG